MTSNRSALSRIARIALCSALILQTVAPAFAGTSRESSAPAARQAPAVVRPVLDLSMPVDANVSGDLGISAEDVQRFASLEPIAVPKAELNAQAQEILRHPAELAVQELTQKGVDLSGRTPDHAVAEQLKAATKGAPVGSQLHSLIAMVDSVIASGGGAARVGQYFDNSKPVMSEDIKSVVNSKEFQRLERIAYWHEDASWLNSVSRLLSGKKAPTKEEQDAAKAKLETMFGAADLSRFELKPEELRWNAPEEKLTVPESLPQGVNPIVGQKRAIDAVRFAVRMPDNHHHLFVAGPAQAGAGDLVDHELREVAPTQPTPFDRVVVTNFQNPDKPLILELPPTAAVQFKKTFDSMLEALKTAFPVWLHQPQTQQRKAAMDAEFYGQLQALIEKRFQPMLDELHPRTIQDFRMKLQVQATERGPQIAIVPLLGTTMVTAENQAEFIANKRFNKDQLGKFQKEARAAAKPILDRLQKIASGNYERVLGQFRAQEMANLLENGDEELGFPSVHGSLMQLVTNGHHSYEGDEAHQAFHAKYDPLTQALNEKVAAVRVGRFGLMPTMVQQQPSQEEFQKAIAEGRNPMEVLMQSMQPRMTMALMLNGEPYALIDGTPVSPELQEIANQNGGELPAEIKAEIDSAAAEARPIAEALIQEIQTLQAQQQAEHEQIHKDAVAELNAQELKAAQRGEQYVNLLVEVLSNMHQAFLPQPAPEKGAPMSFSALMQMFGRQSDPADRFQVSILSTTRGKGAPIVHVPTHSSLEEVMGVVLTPIQEMMSPTGMPVAMRSPGNMGVKTGYVHQAFGGHLVFDAWHLLTTPGLYAAVSEMVQTGVASIREGGLRRIFSEGRELKIPWKGQITIVGSPWLLQLLEYHDPFFKKHFQVSAQMDSRIDINDETVEGFANFVRRQLLLQDAEAALQEMKAKLDANTPPAPFASEKLLDIEPGGVAALMEHGARLIERNDEMTAQWGQLRDVWREASHIARDAKREKVTREDVEQAVAARLDRQNAYRDRILDSHVKDIMHLQLHGEQVGQTNALTVYGGLDGFGSGSRTTVTKSLVGEAGVRDIEKSVGWSGETYNKGVEIINSRLTAMFAKDADGEFRRFPFLLHSAKEQLYGGIDGDSSTSTKIYAGLSQLSEVPIRQSIAMTGSASQFGDVQPIGGANLKIEGWYDFVIARLKLEGKELTPELGAGVIIPASNAKDMMLRKDIVEAVKAGNFHIWAVRRDDEGLSILTRKTIGWILYNANRVLDSALEALRGHDKKK